MNEHLKDRIVRKLDSLADERGYQVLDYIEFLESKYAERQAPQGNAFTRFTDAVEDRLRAGKVSATAIAETMSLLNRAANVLNGAVAAGKSVATDIYTVAQTAARPTPGQNPTGSSTTPPVPPKEASSPAHDVKEPGSGQERL
jgi:hypothetical protein